MQKRKSKSHHASKSKKKKSSRNMEHTKSEANTTIRERTNLIEYSVSCSDYQPTNTEPSQETKNGSCVPWRLGIDELRKDEELQFDRGAYKMLHHLTPPYSMYSFDIIPDSLGQMRSNFPHTMYIVAGTQVENQNPKSSYARDRLYTMKFSQLDSIVDYDDDDSWEAQTTDSRENEIDDCISQEPAVKSFFIGHYGSVNKVAVCPQLKRLVGTWSSNGVVSMWDIKQHLDALDTPGPAPKTDLKPRQSFSGHTDEGYALVFNPHFTGQAASGGCDGYLYIWSPVESGWDVSRCIKTHKKSIEDVQWKQEPNAHNILATSSVDKDVHFIDLRVVENPVIKIECSHASDVNALRWSPIKHNMLLTGSDDCSFKVWDIRSLASSVFEIHWHQKPISAVDWHPIDSEVLAVASYDDSVTIWDMSIIVENTTPGFPDQLLFQHMGQHHISGIQWHPQIPGVMLTTAENGFNIFQTQNV